MRREIRWLVKPLCLLLILSFTLLDLSMPAARAGLVGTETVLNGRSTDDARTRVAAFFDRRDVQTAMRRQGVEPEEAKSRVASLSDAEVARAARAIDRLPAGGDAVGAIVGAALFVFIVLLITDIVGLTHVFPFVRHPAR